MNILTMTNVKETCMLCFGNIESENLEFIQDSTKDMLDAFSVKLNLDECSGSKVCSVCSMKLLAAFEFKSTCTYTEAVIIPYIDWENPTQLDLNDIYLKEKDNKKLVMLRKDEKICRICMELAGNNFLPLREIEKTMLQRFISNMNMDIVRDPVVCKSCLNSFRVHSIFFKNCKLLKRDGQLCEPSFDCYIKTEKVEESSEDEMSNMKMKKNDLRCEEIEQVFIKTEEFAQKHEEDELDGNDSPSGIQKYTCDVCDYKTKAKACLKRHQSKHRGTSKERIYKCEICNYKSNIKYNLKVHQLIHKEPSQVRMYKCNTCDHETRYKTNFKNHLLKHKDPLQLQMYKCDTCKLETRFKRNLIKHQLVHKAPSQVQLYKCDTCDYKTKFENYLKRHQLIHKDPSQVQMYKCDTCDYKTKYKKDLKTHQLKHKDPSQVQMYKCDFCDHETRVKSRLKRHLLTHIDPSQGHMHKCDICPFETRFKDSLRAHQLVHNDPPQV